MEGIDGTLVFWLITLGLIIGGVMKLLMRNKGLKLMTNLAGGVLSALIIGLIAEGIRIPGSMLLALAGTMAILFVGNVFFVGEDAHAHQSTKRSS